MLNYQRVTCMIYLCMQESIDNYFILLDKRYTVHPGVQSITVKFLANWDGHKSISDGSNHLKKTISWDITTSITMVI